MVPLFLLTLLLVSAAQAQMYDMSDGNDEGLISPCIGGPVGRWDLEEPASRYPGGPTTGKVLTSSNSSTSCLDTPTLVHLTRQSKLYLAVRVNPQSGADIFKVWVVNADNLWAEWYSAPGPILDGEEWIQDELLIPNYIAEGDYIIRLDDRSSSYTVSLRYLQITENDYTTTPFAALN